MGRARSVPSKNIPLAVLALSVSFLAGLALGGPAQASELCYNGPVLTHVVAGCTAGDGTY